MSKTIGLIAVLVLVGGVIAAKSMKREAPAVCSVPPSPRAEAANTEGSPAATEGGKTADGPALAQAIPSLLELGSVGCEPCAYMAPIVDSLKKELAGKVFVEFYDVGRDSTMAERYQVMTIPTQIFLDAEGKELFRHTGVFEKAEILSKLQELGMLKG